MTEPGMEMLKSAVWRYRKPLFWGLFFVLFCWVLIAVKEVTALLLLSYVIALLLDPLINRLEKWKLSRGLGVFLTGVILLSALILTVVSLVPVIANEYQTLIQGLPSYLDAFLTKVNELSQQFFGVSLPQSASQITDRVKAHISALESEQVQSVFDAVKETLLRGYSITLTVFNLVLLPFFVFYITRDLREIHAFIGKFLPVNAAIQVREIGSEILSHVYAFFRGQITVCVVMAVFYAVGLSLVGVDLGIIIGMLTGLLNIVPYLGISLGIFLATGITLVTEPNFIHLLLVWGVFACGQVIDGLFLTPKVLGKKVGLQPFAVMLALIVFGKLFGLLGLVAAIPCTAAFRVLFYRLLRAVESEKPNIAA